MQHTATGAVVGSLQENATIQIDIQADATVSYASYQNNVPLLRSLTLTNATDEPLRELEVVVRCEPDFAEAMRLQFERLDAKETRRIDALDLKFQHRYLAEMNEAERGRVIVQVNSAGAEVARTDHAVDVLAYDQWAGARSLPELLAAFSLPNNPAIDRLIFQAGELLWRAGGGRSMNGYQSKNREDVWAQGSAIYSAVAAAGLRYSEPPASFTDDGQKIRTPDRVFSGGVAMTVVHPHEPGKYLLGIECDGATYHSLPTARDRDRLRQIVLEGLGWTLHRVWSTNWWTDHEREIQKLETSLNGRLGASRS